MPALQLNVQQLPQIPDFKLPEPYCHDIWQVTTWDYYKSAPDTQQDYWNRCGHTENPVIDFTICLNPSIKEEIKYFLYTCIEINKIILINFSTYESRLRHLIALVNESYLDISSVNEIEETAFINYLLKNNIIKSVYEKSGTRINKDMEKVDTLKKNRTILLLGHLKKVVTEYYDKATPEFEKDFWNYRNIPFLDKEKLSNQRNLDFTDIKQSYMKEQLKLFCYNQLLNKTASAVNNTLGFIKKFTCWLEKEHPKAIYFEEVNRNILEDFFCWLRTESGFSTSYISHCILNLKNFFEIGVLLEFDHFPKIGLIVSSDYRTKKPIDPEFYSDAEMKNIFNALQKMPNIYAKLVLCFIVLALRAEDLLTLTPNDIEMKGNIPTLRIFQGKTNNPLNLCIPQGIYDLLQDQITISQENYGKDTKYIFARSKNKHITYSAVVVAINKCFYELGVTGDDGNILRFKSHKFRKTKATKLISQGFGAQKAADALGHSGLRSLSSYANVNNETLISSMEPYLKKVDILVNNIGKIQDISKEDMKDTLPLCNGWCCRPISTGICDHANYCLSCSMFKPDIRYLNYYSLQLEEINATLKIAEMDDNKRLIKKLQKDKVQLEKIIERVEKLWQKET